MFFCSCLLGCSSGAEVFLVDAVHSMLAVQSRSRPLNGIYSDLGCWSLMVILVFLLIYGQQRQTVHGVCCIGKSQGHWYQMLTNI